MLFSGKFLSIVTASILFANQIVAQSFSFADGPSMAKPRESHKSALLPNNKVLIIGGNNGLFSNLQYYNTCELYDPTSNAWETGPAMKYERSGFMSAILADGKVLAIGGNNNNQSGMLSTEVYDYITNQWDTTANLQESHYLGAAIALNNGMVLVAGGGVTEKAELYNPVTKTWAYTGNMRVAHGEGMSLTLLQNGTVLAIGGTFNSTAAEIYDPQTGIWTTVGSTGVRREYHSTMLLANGNVLVAGSSYLDLYTQKSVEIYSSYNKIFSTGTSMLTNAANTEIVTLDNNNLLLYSLGDISTLTNSKCFQEYNQSTGKWSSGTYAYVGTLGYTINKLSNGKILITGGTRTTGNGSSNGTLIITQLLGNSCVIPKLDVQLSCTPECYGKPQTINLTGTESGITYTAYIGAQKVATGTATSASLQLSIPNDKISIGKNIVRITAGKQLCINYTLNNQITIDVAYTNTEKPVIVNNNINLLLCGTGDTRSLSVLNPKATGVYYWSNGYYTKTITYTSENFAWVQHIDANGCRSPQSDKLQISQVKASDLKLGDIVYTCVSNTTPLQLQASPTGGTWSGKGVSPTGEFLAPNANMGSNILTYQYCGFTATKTIEVHSPNTVTYSATDINYGEARDTLCQNSTYGITLAQMKSSDQYRLFRNDTLVATSSSNNMFSYYYQPRNSKPINLTLKVSKANPTWGCPNEPIVITKIMTVLPMPKPVSAIITPDTLCKGMTAICKVINPEPGITYYTNFSSQQVLTTAPQDTLQIAGAITSTSETVPLSLTASQSYGCRNSIKVLTKNIISYDYTASLNMSDVYYVNEPVNTNLVSNYHYYTWAIDRQKYNGKNLTHTFNTTGPHTFEATATSKYGCSTNLKHQVSIVNKKPLVSPSCFLDTVASPMYFPYDFLNSTLDKKGNTVMVGAKFMSSLQGIYNGFIVKYDKNNKVLWKIEYPYHYYPNGEFEALFITDVTVDDNNNLYITGGYTATKLNFAGISITHDYKADGHAFVAKISEDGIFQWFIYSTYPYETGVGTYGGIGGASIKYNNNNLYVSMRVRNSSIWKNQYGNIISTPNIDNTLKAEHMIAQVDIEGTSITKLATINSTTSTPAILGSTYVPNTSTIYAGRMAVLQPGLQVLSENKLLVFGVLRSNADFDNIQIKGNQQSEFTGIIDLKNKSWEKVTLEGFSKFLTNQAIDDYNSSGRPYYPVLYLSGMDKISLLSFGPNSISDKNVLYLPNNDSINNIPSKTTLIKRISASGNLVWKKILTNCNVKGLHINNDSSQIIITGTYRGGISSIGDNDLTGLKSNNNSQLNADLFAMGLDATTGEIIWAEQLGSNSNSDAFITSTFDGCNVFNIFGMSNSGQFGRNNDSIKCEFGKLYGARIALSGECNGTNCKTAVVTHTDDELITAVENSVIIYPNPTANIVNIKTSDETALINRVTVITIDNQIVLDYIVNSQKIHTIPYIGLPGGMYIIQTNTNKGVSHHKLVVE